MALGINTNASALNAQRGLVSSQDNLNTAMQRLTTGLRINSAKDDSAGLAIADRMTAQVRGLNQGVRNANDGISLAQTAEGALQESTNILQRMRELSVQSANDTNTGTDRTSLQKEVGQLQQELNRIANTTAFNGKTLLDGTFSAQKFQVGANSSQTIQVSMGSAQASSIGAQRVTTSSASYAVATTSGNAITGGTLTINGSVGSATGTVAAGDSAKTIAATVNGLTAKTGVTARAITQAEFKIASSGAINFELRGQNTTAASGVAISYSASTTAGATDLAGLAAAINDKAGTTGITAKVNDAKTGLTLENADGYDIQVRATATSVATMSLNNVNENGGTGTASTSTTLTAGYLTVGGRVTLESGKSFSESVSAGNLGNGTSTLKDVGTVDITSQAGANDAISVVDNALAFIDDLRGDLGAVQNRFDSTISNLQNVSDNITSARSRIQDADFGKETSNLSKSQILQQAGIAMLSQANQAQQNVLSLLR
ncbi:MAG: flagellin [Candidatus Competibacter sp.]|jgi:flagellin